MEKTKKWLAVLAIFLLLSSIVAAAIVIQLYLSTKVKLIIPHDIRAEPAIWDWDTLTLWVDNDTAVSTQKVTFTSYGAKPLTLSAKVDGSSVSPAWFNTPDYYSLDWTAEDYEIQPLDILETTFTLTVDVPLVRDYMILNQIMEADITFDITVSADYILIYHNLTIETTLGGTTDPAPGVYEYREGKVVTVTGIPDIGYTVDCWDLDGVNYTINPITVTMDADHSLTAYFKETLVEPTLYVDPEHNSFGLGKSFVINASVIDITDLTTWQVKIYFDSSLLNCTNAWYPSDHVFAGMIHVPVLPSIDNDMGYVSYGCCLMGETEGFSGSGTLCQIEFSVIGFGNCALHFSEPYGEDTYLWDSYDVEITVTIEDGYFDNS